MSIIASGKRVVAAIARCVLAAGTLLCGMAAGVVGAWVAKSAGASVGGMVVAAVAVAGVFLSVGYISPVTYRRSLHRWFLTQADLVEILLGLWDEVEPEAPQTAPQLLANPAFLEWADTHAEHVVRQDLVWEFGDPDLWAPDVWDEAHDRHAALLALMHDAYGRRARLGGGAR